MQRLAAPKPFETGNGIVENHFAAMQDLHAITHGLDFRKNVRRQNQAVIAAQVSDQGADLANLVGVEPDGRLVEDDDVRLMDDGSIPTRC